MEVGAVKQAYNNEVIHLKKKLNQAKTQVIHKLTRKAKNLKEKKAPEKLQVKLKNKAESAVKEVLLIKKITAKHLARFALTHEGELKKYLNRPVVDTNKACARLLLHKTLQDKYAFLRDRFSNIPIKDLFMSRQERIKSKKEAIEAQKKRREGKSEKPGNNENATVSTRNNWNVEEVTVDTTATKEINSPVSDLALENDIETDDGGSEEEELVENDSNLDLDDYTDNVDEEESKDTDRPIIYDKSNKESNKLSNMDKTINIKSFLDIKNNRNDIKKSYRKSKNVSAKFQQKRNNVDCQPIQENKIVDPFFITSTGENYMSLVEPRPPDEVKEVHKEGNRKLRRAAMFGHVPKFKRKNQYVPQNDRNKNISNITATSHTKFSKSKEGEKNRKINNHSDKNNSINKSNANKPPEKLHPSWEAKKRLSSIQPFQGKKIVFD